MSHFGLFRCSVMQKISTYKNILFFNIFNKFGVLSPKKEVPDHMVAMKRIVICPLAVSILIVHYWVDHYALKGLSQRKKKKLNTMQRAYNQLPYLQCQRKSSHIMRCAI